MGVRGNGQRIFILLIVVVFFLTSVAFTIFVIYEQSKNNDAQSAQESIQKQLEEQTKQQEEANKSQEPKLEGTKLANFTPVGTVESLQIVDLKEGTGDPVAAGATVTAHYTGALAKDGTIFQSSYDAGKPASFSLKQVIKGWQEGVPGMKVGGERRLIIPASMAYGSQEQQGIPANSDLVFDITLVAVGQ